MLLGIGIFSLRKQAKHRKRQIGELLRALPQKYDGDMDYANVFEQIRLSLLEYQDNESKYLETIGKANLWHIITADKDENIEEYKSKYYFEKAGELRFYVAAFFYEVSSEYNDEGNIGNKHGLQTMVELLFRSTMEEIIKRENDMFYEVCSDHRIQVAILWGENGSTCWKQLSGYAIMQQIFC